jgi:hypothetical protein
MYAASFQSSSQQVHIYPLIAYSWHVIFIELPLFSKYASFTDEELHLLQLELLENPLAGALIPGSHGLRKLRVALEGRGKRGGARVIYYWWQTQDQCYLVFAYRKTRWKI